MEQAEQQMPVKYMTEIVRFFLKLKEADLAVNDIVIDEVREVVNNKLQTTYTLKVKTTPIATYVLTDNRSLETIKEQVEAQKATIQAQSNEVIAKADEIIATVEPKIK